MGLNKIKEKFAGMRSKGIERIEPREEEPEQNPLENIDKNEKKEEPEVQQVPVPIFLTRQDLDKMVYETNLLVKDLYNHFLGKKN